MPLDIYHVFDKIIKNTEVIMRSTLLSYFLAITFSTITYAEVAPQSTAPDFKLNDLSGKERKLSDFKGKWVVLEWFNKDCPFVKKHYGSANMQKLQSTYTGKGVVWLTINSSAPGKQGNETATEALKTKESLKANPSYVLADASGVVGQLYSAKTTPHMFVISPEQKIVYAGAIDDNSSSDPAVIPASKNYVAAALDASFAGKKVAVQSSKPYGCGVKY